MNEINCGLLFFLIMTVVFAVLSIIAWFSYSTFVSYMLKRQEILRRFGLPALGSRSRVDLEEPLFKTYIRITLLIGLLVASFPFVIMVLQFIGVLR